MRKWVTEELASGVQQMCEQYGELVPHSGAMGQTIIAVEKGRAVMRQPWRPELLGDSERGLIHTSVQLTLVDSTFGVAVFSALGVAESIATLDLRMDYLRPAVAGKDIYAEATVERVTRQIVFIRGRIWQTESSSGGSVETALARATFMRGANARPVMTKAS